MEKVFITGVGIVSALGKDVDSCLNSLKNSITGIRKAKHFESKYTSTLLFGEVDLSTVDLKKTTDSLHEKGVTRSTLLAYLACQEAINMAKIDTEGIQSITTGLISASTVGGMCNTEELYADANKNDEPSDFLETYAGGDHILALAKKFGVRGFTTCINTACSSSANAIMLGARLIKSGRAKRVIVGGTDSLAKYTVNGFNSLMILSQSPCRPFDEKRDGLNLGEGAGYLILEAESVCENKKKLAELIGYGNSNDAHHPSATSAEANGPQLAMKRALETAGINPAEIDYINAHGTGTVNNDETELFAFNQIFETIPPYNSTKSYTGHTLAASGSIEAILSLMSMQEGEVYPSLNCENPIGEAPIQIIKKLDTVKNIMSNSFGFGGNCTSLILKKV